jgi:hypothetical protein
MSDSNSSSKIPGGDDLVVERRTKKKTKKKTTPAMPRLASTLPTPVAPVATSSLLHGLLATDGEEGEEPVEVLKTSKPSTNALQNILLHSGKLMEGEEEEDGEGIEHVVRMPSSSEEGDSLDVMLLHQQQQQRKVDNRDVDGDDADDAEHNHTKPIITTATTVTSTSTVSTTTTPPSTLAPSSSDHEGKSESTQWIGSSLRSAWSNISSAFVKPTSSTVREISLCFVCFLIDVSRETEQCS